MRILLRKFSVKFVMLVDLVVNNHSQLDDGVECAATEAFSGDLGEVTLCNRLLPCKTHWVLVS